MAERRERDNGRGLRWGVPVLIVLFPVLWWALDMHPLPALLLASAFGLVAFRLGRGDPGF